MNTRTKVALCVLMGLGVLWVLSIQSPTNPIHVISSTAMCAVAKAITLKGIWSRDFTCMRCLPSKHYFEPSADEFAREWSRCRQMGIVRSSILCRYSHHDHWHQSTVPNRPSASSSSRFPSCALFSLTSLLSRNRIAPRLEYRTAIGDFFGELHLIIPCSTARTTATGFAMRMMRPIRLSRMDMWIDDSHRYHWRRIMLSGWRSWMWGWNTMTWRRGNGLGRGGVQGAF